MGMWARIKMIFGAKANKALDKLEDPRQTLDYSYEKQLQLLGETRKGLAEVATSRKRLELQAGELRKQAETLTQQAQAAVNAGRDDLAREALTRKAALVPQMADLEQQHTSLAEQEKKLSTALTTLTSQVEQFRTRKETIKATYSAAQAQAKIGEAFSGIGGEFENVGLAIQRAEDKTAQLQSRAGAIDELVAGGALPNALGTSDPLAAELTRIGADASVEAELARLKGALPAAQEPQAIEGSAASPAVDPTVDYRKDKKSI